MTDAARRSELRRVARRHHPDLGGDLEAYLAAVEAIRALDAGGSGADRHGAVDIRRARAWRRAVRRLRRRLRRLRRERRDRRRRGVDAHVAARRGR